ncbi:MAG: sugar ABC transporter substrate-binding protein [Halanaerobiales bacterium]|nr:sugar ABC transporter substrate-binding protein [Halanaerobiales bacterium]
MKKLIAVLLVTMLLTGLVGCGNGAEQETAEKELVELTLLGWGGVEEEKIVNGYLDEFHKVNPNIKVEFIRPADYWPKLGTMISSGTAPDAFYMGFPEFAEYHKQGVLLNLSEYAKASNFDEADFMAGQLDSFSDPNSGDLYGVPKDWSSYVIYYNKAMFEEVGLPTPNEMYNEDNWTYDTFVSTAKKLTNSNHHGAVVNYGRWKAFVSDWVDKDSREVKVDTLEFANGLQYLADLGVKKKVIPTVDELADLSPADRFSNEKAAMFMCGRWMAMRFIDVGFEWDIAPMPSDVKASTWIDLVAYCGSADTEHPEETWKLIEFLTGKKIQEQVAKAGHAIPARKSVANSPAFLDSIPVNNKAHLEINSEPLPVFNNWGEVWDALNRNFESVWTGEDTAAEAVKAAQKEIDGILK